MFDDDDDKEEEGKKPQKPKDDGGKAQKPEEDDGEDVEVEEGEDGGVALKPTRSEPRGQRDQKKRARYEEMELRARMAELERDQTRQHLQLLSQQIPQNQGPDPAKQLEEEEDELHKQKGLLWQSFVAKGAKITPEEKSQFEKDARSLDKKISAIHYKQHSLSAQPQGGPPTETQIQTSMLRAEFPDVFSDPRAWDFAMGTLSRERALGRLPNLAVARDVLTLARTFRQNGYQEPTAPPSPRRRQQYSGKPSGPQGSSNGSEVISLSPELKKKVLLGHRKPGESEQETLRRWAKKSGKAYMERLKDRGA